MVAIAMMATTAMAQDNQGPRPERKIDKAEMVKMRTERMAKEYGLDASQQEKLLVLNTEYADKMPMRGQRGPRGGRPGGPRPEKVDGTTGATPQNNAQMEKPESPSREQMEARRNEMRANREAYNGELKKILTPEQFAKYEAAEKQRMERGHRGGPRPGNRQ